MPKGTNTEPIPESLLLTVKQAAKLLEFSPKALRAKIERGQIPGVVRIGRNVRIVRARLEQWLAKVR